MRVVVLLSSYNGEKYIGQQLDSIFNQKLDGIDLTVVVRDDGSSDGTLDILNSYLSTHNNLTVLKGNNSGFIASFFSLISYSYETGLFDYYCLSDQDDFWLPDKIISGITQMRGNNDSNGPCLYMSSSKPVDENLKPCGKAKKIKRKPTFYNAIVQNLLPGHTYIFNNELAKRIPKNIECDRIYAHDSYLLNLALLTGEVLYDPEPHSLYRQHHQNQMGTSNNGVVKWIKNRIIRMKKGELGKYTKQIAYVVESLGEYLDLEQKKQVDKLISAKLSFPARFAHSFTMKPYRVGFINNIAFKILYVLGKYKYE